MSSSSSQNLTPASQPGSKPDDKPVLGLLATIIGGVVTVASFAFNFGLVFVGVIIIITAVLADFHLRHGVSVERYLRDHYPTALRRGVIGAGVIVGLALIMWGAWTTYRTSDIFRADFGIRPMKITASPAAAADWYTLPPTAASASQRTEYELAGWKRLMQSAVASNPANSNGVTKQLFYIESEPFNKNYRTVNVELEVPTYLEIGELFCFLSVESSTRSSHELLETLNTLNPIGTDRNRAAIFVPSPNLGERVVIFAVVSLKTSGNTMPKNVSDNITLRSIR